MSDIPEHASKTIADLQEKIVEYERLTNKVKLSVNALCALYDAEPIYALDDMISSTSMARMPGLTFRPDEFFGKPFSTCVREILNARKARDLGPADPKEVFEALRSGGFAFDAKDDESAFRGMQISISKNTAVFVRLPSGQIGLEEWYDRTRRPKPRGGSAATAVMQPLVANSGDHPWPLPPPPVASPGPESNEEDIA